MALWRVSNEGDRWPYFLHLFYMISSDHLPDVFLAVFSFLKAHSSPNTLNTWETFILHCYLFSTSVAQIEIPSATFIIKDNHFTQIKMQLPASYTVPLLSFLSLAVLPALVVGDACVSGGPAAEVTAAEKCCFASNGTWYQFYSVQAICVMDTTKVDDYQKCLSYIPAIGGVTLDIRCIPGDGPSLGGVNSTSTAT